jgi:hypothetical protein
VKKALAGKKISERRNDDRSGEPRKRYETTIAENGGGARHRFRIRHKRTI